VLQRQNPKPKPDWADRMVMAALARLPPRPLRMNRLVTADTLLRWHQFLVRWRWTYPHRCGCPPVDARMAVLIEQMARENPGWAQADPGRTALPWNTGSAPNLRATAPAGNPGRVNRAL